MKMPLGFNLLLCFCLYSMVGNSKQEACPFNPLCTCVSSPLDVSCVGVSMATLPKLPLEDLYQVEVARSGLEVLHAEALGGARVSSLRLIHNDIVEISSRAFRGTELFLTSIDASFNQIQEIPVSAIRQLEYLQWLNLHSNSIETVHAGMFWELESRTYIRNIMLGGNNIMLIEDGCFYPLFNLTSLDLEGNRITHLEGKPFPPSLNRLSLRDNLLSSVPSTALSNLASLAWLQLGGNLIRKLPDRLRLPVKTVLKLDLAHNLLTHLTSNMFNATLSVRDLHLDFNFIRVIPDRAFQHLAVERLSLSNNRLTTVSLEAFEGVVKTLKAVDFSYNLIERLPKALKSLTGLRQLYLRANQLRKLDHLVFFGFRDTLEVLDISDNALTEMPLDALSVLKKIAKLNLHHNQIVELGKRDFHGWGSTLVYLNLDNNGLESIAQETFLFTPKLRELRMSYNCLLVPEPKFLLPLRGKLEILELGAQFGHHSVAHKITTQHMEKVEWFQLNQNDLKSLSHGGLSGYPSLVHCDLVESKIRRLPGLFDGDIHLKLSNVLMSYNDLEAVETKSFYNLPQLTNIVLFGNRIRYVGSRSFDTLPNLHTIILTSNQLNFVEDNAFTNVSRLTNLYLQENRLTEFSWTVFGGLGKSALFLNVSSNNITVLSPPPFPDNDTNEPELTVTVRTLDLSKNNIADLPLRFLRPVRRSLHYLFLSHNLFKSLRDNQFSEAKHLQVLSVDHSSLTKLGKETFGGCKELQILNLQHNLIESLHQEIFGHLETLRLVDLSHNKLNSIPPELFVNTILERVDFSHNNLIRAPLPPLFTVRNTLRYLDFSGNHIGMMPALELNNLIHLIHLNISRNRIGGLTEETFRELRHLVHLDMSHNPVWRLDGGPFQPLTSLRTLDLTNTSLATLPVLPLKKLRWLSLSQNLLTNISDHAVKDLQGLRHLDISSNMFHDVPSHLWKHMRNLLSLDISNNPVEALGVATFHGLQKLQDLDIRKLKLRVLDTRVLYSLSFLSNFKTSTYPRLRAFRLHDLLSKSESLKRILVDIRETTLSHQLQWTFGSKLRELVVTGRHLENILPDAFLGLQHTHELILRITGTSVKKLPDYLIRYMADIRYLTLDLRNNHMSHMEPEVLKVVPGSKDPGTRHISGGVLLSENPWLCSCSLLWTGQWLRRWMRETVRVQILQFDAALLVHSFASRPTCQLPGTNRNVPLVDLSPELLKCQGLASVASQFKSLDVLLILSALFFIHVTR